MLCCDVLCCDVLCCAVMWCDVLCCVVFVNMWSASWDCLMRWACLCGEWGCARGSVCMECVQRGRWDRLEWDDWLFVTVWYMFIRVSLTSQLWRGGWQSFLVSPTTSTRSWAMHTVFIHTYVRTYCWVCVSVLETLAVSSWQLWTSNFESVMLHSSISYRTYAWIFKAWERSRGHAIKADGIWGAEFLCPEGSQLGVRVCKGTGNQGEHAWTTSECLLRRYVCTEDDIYGLCHVESVEVQLAKWTSKVCECTDVHTYVGMWHACQGYMYTVPPSVLEVGHAMGCP